MSLLTEALIFDKYGPRLTSKQLAEFLGVAERTLYNQIAAGTCVVPTYIDGKARYADCRDVAAHLDACRARAA